MALRYLHPDDNLIRDVVPTLPTGTQDAEYPVANLTDDDPAQPWKVTTTTFRLVWDLTNPTTVRYIAIVHHNLAAALAGVVFQMNATDSWGAPSFSTTIVPPAYHEDDFPENIGVDLTDDAPSFRYASLAVTSANAVACAIGELVIATSLRSLTRAIRPDLEDLENHPVKENVTVADVSWIYQYGTRQRSFRGSVLESIAVADQIRSWTRATFDRSRPFVIVPDLTTPDEPWFVRFAPGSLVRQYFDANVHGFRMDFTEVSRGLKPTPSAV